MKREDVLKDYYKTLEDASPIALQEYQDELLETIADYKATGNKQKAKELEGDLKKVRELIKEKEGK